MSKINRQTLIDFVPAKNASVARKKFIARKVHEGYSPTGIREKIKSVRVVKTSKRQRGMRLYKVRF